MVRSDDEFMEARISLYALIGLSNEIQLSYRNGSGSNYSIKRKHSGNYVANTALESCIGRSPTTPRCEAFEDMVDRCNYAR